ncbi:RHS repeat domain-containing protein [Pseudoalteromonas prydzensis]|uniref:RHS repeat domain-containing protein n=1 Tax=Pseudoalteromonas prydzensis TaxID=182141 RepID=UPI003FD69FDC
MPDASKLNYSYNKFGQLSAIHLQKANSTAVELAQLSYDSQGNIQTQKFGNDVTLTQQFDVFNRLTQQQLTHPTQALFDTCTYNYDSVNQLIARKEEGVSSHNINFEYNSLGQLIQQNLASSEVDTTTQYQWDSFGNPVSQSKIQNNELAEQQTTQANNDSDASDTSNKVESSQSESTINVSHSEYNYSSLATAASDLSEGNGVISSATEADRLTHFGDSDFHYDEFGNQIRETGKGIKTRREYNAFNQLSCFNNNGTLTQYDYDPLGRRIAKHTEQGKIDYIWDNDQLIGEYQHGEYTWYINLPNQFHPIALIKKGEVYYYHLDQLNTPRFVTNNKAEVVWENQADVYGYEESEVNNTNNFTQPIRFQGQYLDEESGLHYNRYRYYSPKQQRFINQDPIGLVGGINHYQYAPNPVNWVDPMGLLCKEGQAKVAEAINNSDNISPDLAKQLIEIAQLIDSPYTADEMVDHINSGTAKQLIAKDKPEPNPEPKSLEECQERLNTARENIIKNGYKAKYSDDELLAMAKAGDVANERFHVRFMDASYLEYKGKPGNLGQPFEGVSGYGAKYWSTTFDQIEDADTDPKIISEKLGLDYDPSKEFVMVIVDTDKAKVIADTHSIIPTHERLGNFAKEELPDSFSHEEINILMTPEFQANYSKQYQAALDSGEMKNEWDNAGAVKYFKNNTTDPTQYKLMKKRLDMQKKLGNNQHFLGNGLTKTLLPNNGEFGAVETFNFERKLINLEEFGDAIQISDILKPIGS